MTMDLYYFPDSPPCVAVLLVANCLGVKFNLKTIDLFQGEHLKPSFVKINPQHMLPTLVDGDFVLWESRAIIQYLANKHDVEGKLYPKGPKERAKVNKMLYFDMGALYQQLVFYCIYFIIGLEENLNPDIKAKLEEGLDSLEIFLEKHTFAAGYNLSIADHSLAVTVLSIKVCDVIDMEKYHRINEWLSRCENEIPGFNDVTSGPINTFGRSIKGRISEKLQNKHSS